MNKQQIFNMVNQFNELMDACREIAKDAEAQFDRILTDLELAKTFTPQEINVIWEKKNNCPLITNVFNKDYVFPFQSSDPSYEYGKLNYEEEGVVFTAGDEFNSEWFTTYYHWCAPYDLIEAYMDETLNVAERDRLLDHKLREYITEVAKECGFEAERKQQQAIKSILRQMDRYGITNEMLEGK